MPPLAADYADVAAQIASAAGQRDGAVSPELAGNFDELVKLLHNASTETAFSLDRLGPALVGIAEDDQQSEGEIAQVMGGMADSIQTEVYDSTGYTPMTEGETASEMDEAPADFADELANGTGDNQPGGPNRID